MLRPTEIIVYRSPLEAQLYNSNMLWPIMASIFFAFVITLIVLKLCDTMGAKYRADYVAIGTLVTAFITIIHFVYGV